MSTPDVAATLLEILRDLIATVGDGRGLGNLGLDANLERELGLGSLERVELLGRVEARFNVKLPEEAISVVETPRQLLALVERALGTPAHSDMPSETGPSGQPRGLPTDAPHPPPARAGTLVEVLEYHARHHADRVHILLLREDGREDPITYGELRREAGAVAAALRGLGLKPGGTVAIMLPTGRGYFASFLGAMLAGGVPVPLYPPFRLDRIAEYIAREAKILENAGTEILLTFDRAARVADMIRDQVAVLRHVASADAILAEPAPPSWIAAEVTPDDTALLQYTSGSTGDPKGVELTQANVLANIRAAAAGCELTADDVMVSWLPLYHDMGLIGGWLMSFYFGNPTVLMSPVSFLSRPERWLQALSTYRGTLSVAPNFAFDLCVRRITTEQLAGLDLSPRTRPAQRLRADPPHHPRSLRRPPRARRPAPGGPVLRLRPRREHGRRHLPPGGPPPARRSIDRKTFEQGRPRRTCPRGQQGRPPLRRLRQRRPAPRDPRRRQGRRPAARPPPGRPAVPRPVRVQGLLPQPRGHREGQAPRRLERHRRPRLPGRRRSLHHRPHQRSNH
jgi:fatty-acyl-CoA synthase